MSEKQAVRTIPLTQGKSTIVDASDYEELSKQKWFLHHEGYAVRNSLGGRLNRSALMLHRVIVKPPPNMVVDHINGDKLDNRKANLRIVNRQQNRVNAGGNKNSKSRFKGVYLSSHNKKNPWFVRITSCRKQIHIGCYATEEDAARAYNVAAREHFGEYARLNELEG